VNVPGLSVVGMGMDDPSVGGATIETGVSPVSLARQPTFSAFVEDRLAGLYRLASVILGEPAESEDAVHDALERAWRSWPRLQDVGRVDAWVTRILVNECRDRLRRRRRRPVTDISDVVAGSLAGPDDLRATVDRDEIGRAFAVLNPDQRIAVVLRYYADLSVDQIAERVGIPSGTVKSRLHHALAAMNAELARARTDEELR